MARVLFALALVACAIVQGTVLPALVPGVALPNPVLVLVLLRTVRRGAVEGVIAAVVGGVVLDVLALDPLGVNGIALLAAVLAGMVARRPVFHSNVLFPMLLVVVATGLHAGLLTLARMFGGEAVAGPQVGIGLTLLQGLLNAALVPAFYALGLLVARFEPEATR